MSDPLDPSALLSTLPTLLPDGDILQCPQDALTALLHTLFVAYSFVLIGIDDSSSVSTFDRNRLTVQWNERRPNHYNLRYRHERSSLQYLLTVTKLSDRTLFHAMALGTDRVASLDIKTEDFTSHSFFPHTLVSDRPLVHGFISSNRITDLTGSMGLKIFSVLMPDLGKGGISGGGDRGSNSQQYPSRGAQTPPAQPQPPIPPTGPWQQPGYHPPGNPPSIGRRDLDPIPTNPFTPPSLFGSHRNDGMFVGPDHPIFGPDRHDPFGGGPSGMTGPWGGDGFLPPMGAPPGARFDPIIPGQQPWQNNRNRGIRGDPSNDEFMPPGFDNDSRMPPPPGYRDMFM